MRRRRGKREKCRSVVQTGTFRTSAEAAIQMSLDGTGVPAAFRWRNSSEYSELSSRPAGRNSTARLCRNSSRTATRLRPERVAGSHPARNSASTAAGTRSRSNARSVAAVTAPSRSKKATRTHVSMTTAFTSTPPRPPWRNPPSLETRAFPLHPSRTGFRRTA